MQSDRAHTGATSTGETDVLSDAATFERGGAALDGAERSVFYLEIPPALFGIVVKGPAGAGLTVAPRRAAGDAVRRPKAFPIAP